MDFESPEVMKDFPGLYVSDTNKKGNNDSDYSDDVDRVTKKDLLMGKRKDKKDKKDKERGYAALEGESSPDESCDAKSPSKTKKSKSFKFSSKSKEKREKSRDKDATIDNKKKDKEKKSDKKSDRDKKTEKKERKVKYADDCPDIADKLPIFGVSLDLAIERSRCHDGIDIPYPVRACINYLQTFGYNFEGVYKVTGSKSKAIQIKKMFNNRELVNLNDYDVPTVTSLLKLYLRDMPDSILTNELSIRFEEAGAILNIGTREKHLKILVENLPFQNKLLLSWLLLHFDYIICNERLNKTSIQNLVTTMSPVLRMSARLLTAFLYHCHVLFPDAIVKPYVPPLTSASELPLETELIEEELRKQESLLSQIHMEIHSGFISKSREELMWEVQRIITQLKRTYKNVQKDKDQLSEKSNDDKVVQPATDSEEKATTTEKGEFEESKSLEENNTMEIPAEVVANTASEPQQSEIKEEVQPRPQLRDIDESDEFTSLNNAITLLQVKNNSLLQLKEKLRKAIETEKNEIHILSKQVKAITEPTSYNVCNIGGTSTNLDEIMDLLSKENQILQIKKINLVRYIMEQQEICIDIKARLHLIGLETLK